MTTRSKLQAAVSVYDITPELISHLGPAPELAAVRSASTDEFDAAIEGWLPGYAQWSNAA
ncbi:hypothetical protein EDF52_113149 [Curtobacterium sp. PhB42]|uniref:hypothetical protein n=1 Tax=unclassified Curtobacterium TaxID=257496 RepID=UPI001063DCE6|nr:MULTISPECIES: hypothetical protein [unclassified Curtobacterium]TDW43195.1 hypothetical protein EDF52_113149 [Curtobacterium sp. PhB42]TDW53508.1 hypothetical protein EDF47_10920 [Curtobacterium sp. PhB190]